VHSVIGSLLAAWWRSRLPITDGADGRGDMNEADREAPIA
jgi:hypothetical protein